MQQAHCEGHAKRNTLRSYLVLGSGKSSSKIDNSYTRYIPKRHAYLARQTRSTNPCPTANISIMSGSFSSAIEIRTAPMADLYPCYVRRMSNRAAMPGLHVLNSTQANVSSESQGDKLPKAIDMLVYIHKARAEHRTTLIRRAGCQHGSVLALLCMTCSSPSRLRYVSRPKAYILAIFLYSPCYHAPRRSGCYLDHRSIARPAVSASSKAPNILS